MGLRLLMSPNMAVGQLLFGFGGVGGDPPALGLSREFQADMRGEFGRFAFDIRGGDLQLIDGGGSGVREAGELHKARQGFAVRFFQFRR